MSIDLGRMFAAIDEVVEQEWKKVPVAQRRRAAYMFDELFCDAPECVPRTWPAFRKSWMVYHGETGEWP